MQGMDTGYGYHVIFIFIFIHLMLRVGFISCLGIKIDFSQEAICLRKPLKETPLPHNLNYHNSSSFDSSIQSITFVNLVNLANLRQLNPCFP